MANFNKVILAGNLTRDPELRYTPKGTAVARITLAINRTYGGGEGGGEKKEEVSFVDVDVWGRQAEVISQYMKKGRPLLVEGRLKQDTWEDKNTKQKQSKLKVVLESFSFITANSSRADKDILRQSYYQLSQLYRRLQKPGESKKALEVFLSMKQEADVREGQKLQDKLKRASKETEEHE